MKKITMKKLMIGLGLFFTGSLAMAQNGLENVIVETYYISDANDANNSIGALPVGSVTYRVFVDMLPGYKFEAIYGVPGHPLSITTNTTFFNNEDRGSYQPNGINTQYWNDNSVALDTWFSVGGAGNGHIGVLKAEDDGVSNIVATGNSMLQNNAAAAGIPLTSQDGLILGTPEAVTFVGFTQAMLDPFYATSQFGNSLVTSNASVASLNGSYGPDSLTNKVLIGQFTTDGDFCFSLNIQIGTPTGGFQNYVDLAPVGNEIQPTFLHWCSHSVNVTPPSPSASSLSLFPNPATDAVTIDIKSSSQINGNTYRIMDVVGNVIADKDLGSISGRYTEKVDISGFAKGIYFIEFTLNGEKSTKKIVKY